MTLQSVCLMLIAACALTQVQAAMYDVRWVPVQDNCISHCDASDSLNERFSESHIECTKFCTLDRAPCRNFDPTTFMCIPERIADVQQAPGGASPCKDNSQPTCPGGTQPTGNPPMCASGTPKCADGSDPAPPPNADTPSPAVASTICDRTGKDANITMSDLDTDFIKVSTNNCPKVNWGPKINPNEAIKQTFTYTIPKVPVFAAKPSVSPLTKLGPLGFTLGGVAIFGPAPGPTGGDAILQEGKTFDVCGGHAQQQGVYHYHVLPGCLLNATKAIVTPGATSDFDRKCPVLGFAVDGFPIRAHSDVDCNMQGKLDECNGALVDGKYSYYFTGPSASHQWPSTWESSIVNGSTLGKGYPYIFGCFKGCVPDQNGAGFNVESTYAKCVASGTRSNNANTPPAAVPTINDTSVGGRLTVARATLVSGVLSAMVLLWTL